MQPNRREQVDPIRAACALLSEDGAYALSPQPVVLVRPDCTMIAANRAASRIVPLLGPDGPLAGLVRSAVETGVFTHESLAPDDSGDNGTVWELNVLPLPGGTGAIVQGLDLTHDRALTEALVDSRQRYKDLVEISSDFVWETGSGGRFSFVSPGGALGYPVDQLVERHPSEFYSSDMPFNDTSPFVTHTRVTDVEVWFRRADGQNALLLASAVPVLNERGLWRGARGICRDTTESHDRDAALAAAQTRERLLAYVVRAMHDEINPTNMLMAAATATARALATTNCRIYRGDPTAGFMLAAEHAPSTDHEPLERQLLADAVTDTAPMMAVDADRHLMCIATPYRKSVNGAFAVVRRVEAGAWTQDDVGLAQDIAVQLAIAIEQIDYHTKLEALSRTDDLTGLLNRRAFFAELGARLERANASPSTGVLFYIDLDNFKLVNDVHGHTRGDEALIAVAKLLVAKTRPGDLVGRLGGDEFCLWLDRTDETAAVLRAEELLEAAENLRCLSGDNTRPLTMSIGIATSLLENGDTVASLTECADAAMYEVKCSLKGGYHIAPPACGIGASDPLETVSV